MKFLRVILEALINWMATYSFVALAGQWWGFLELRWAPVETSWVKLCYRGGQRWSVKAGQQSRVRLWCERCAWCSWCGGAYGSILVASTIADVWRQGVHGFVSSRCQEGFTCWPWWWGLAWFASKDESSLILLLKVGYVLHHRFMVRDRQLVRAIWHQVEVSGDEDNRERKHGHSDKSEAHGQSPGRIALEAFLSLKWQRGEMKRKHFSNVPGEN